jgi:hypothetical protein
MPYVEPDKQSKLGSVFTGIADAFRSASDFYREVRYKPEPVRTTTIGPYYGQYGPIEQPVYGGGFAAGDGIMPLVVVGGILLALMFLRK